MEPVMLLGVLIVIVVIGYAVVNIVFKLAGDAMTFLEENKAGILIIVVILIGLWLAVHS
jgi:hypothetical protein